MKRETTDAVSIVFDRVDEGFDYAPGQFLTVRVPGDHGAVARCYSLSSSPGLDSDLQITVKRTAGGYASNWLCDNIVEGSRLDVLRPAGLFVPQRWDVDFLLFAGGSGITPILSILKTALHRHRNKMTLVYANRDAESVIFDRELSNLVRLHPTRLKVVRWLESESGLPTARGIHRRLLDKPGGDVFICGPGPFMTVVEEYLQKARVPRDRVRKEVFVSLSADAFEAPIGAAIVDDQDAATVLAEVNGSAHRVSWPRQTLLLDALLNEGLDPPYVCREGSCGSCAFTLRRGEVKMLANDTLDSYEVDRGVRLACQSLPLTDDLHAVFDR